MDPAEVTTRFGGKTRVIFVDARSPRSWAESDRRLPDALRISVDQMDLLTRIPRGHPIVVYCT